MRIQHNIMAMNAYRNYNNNTSALSANLEKLSSGYKINRAGDDAAGLAISEKMRAQITGLSKAQDNAKDGISLVQTAEGALTEVHDMLNRMVELAEQSANGTYEDSTDRVQLQKEVDQLMDEINRIADSANFNGIQLLDGSMAGESTISTISLDGLTALTSTSIATSGTAIGTNTIVFEEGKEALKTKFEVDLSDLTWTAGRVGDTLTITIGNASITVTAAATGDQDIGAMISTYLGTTSTADVAGQAGVTAAQFNVTYANGKLTFELSGDPNALTGAATAALGAQYTVSISAVTANGGSISGSNWNAGTTVLQQGQQGHGDILANTVITQTNMGFATAAADNDGFAMTIGGKTYVIAVGDDSKFGNVTGATSVKVDKNATVNEQLQALANAITADNEVWTAGVNAAGALTLAQKSGTSNAINESLDTIGEIASSIQTGKAVVETTTTVGGKPLTLQIGDTSDSFNQLEVSIKDCHVDAIGIGDISIATQEGAQAAVSVIKDAINYISDVRGTLGATQNRLDHTINNLSVMEENIQDAESTIRDTDVAEEMMEYTKNNILIQSAQAMLAQANQVPQGVLQLLQ